MSPVRFWEAASLKTTLYKGPNLLLTTIVTIIHVLVALFMILVVLVQGGNQGGVGAAFGGGNSSGLFGAGGATSFLGKLTYGAAFIFMMTTISLTVIQGRSGHVGLMKKLETSDTISPAPLDAGQNAAAVIPSQEPATPAPSAK